MSQKIILINLFGSPVSPSSFNPDNSLAALAGNLKNAGYSPEIIDYQNLEFAERLMDKNLGQNIFEIVSVGFKKKLNDIQIKELSRLNHLLLKTQEELIKETAAVLIQKIQTEKPLFLGLKIYSGEGTHFNRILVQEIKKHCQTPIVGGGPLIRVIGKQYLNLYPEFDFLIDGEADLSIVKFAQYLQNKISFQQVPGLISKFACNPPDIIEDLNVLADPCYDEDVYPILYEGNKKTLVFQIDESRGCPNSCSFCVHPIINDRVFRTVHPQKIIHQITQIQSKFGAMAFRFTGSNTPKKFLNQFTDLVQQQNLNIRFSCYASINTTTPQEIQRYQKAGLAGVFIGVETTDQNILVEMFNKKGQDLEKVKSVLKTCLENDVYTTTSWIYPMPGYNEIIKRQMRDFIFEIYNGYTIDHGSVMVVPSALIPNTEWFYNPKKYGFNIKNKESFYRGYAELNLRFWMPRSLFNDWQYDLEGETFLDLANECDSLVYELNQLNIPLGITDDWMLQGKLSHLSMDVFKKTMIESFLSGQYQNVQKIVDQINTNSRLQLWPEKIKKVA